MNSKRETELYRQYVTESLRLRGEGKYINVPYEKLKHPQDDFDVDEVIERVVSRGGLEVMDDESA